MRYLDVKSLTSNRWPSARVACGSGQRFSGTRPARAGAVGAPQPGHHALRRRCESRPLPSRLS